MTRPNVVLIVMDTARARSVLGREDVAPGLHRLAGDGVAFENAFASSPWTLPSHASLFTGRYASQHGTHAGAPSFDPDVEPLAEALSAAGYRTYAVSNNTWVSPEFGFDRGFDEFRVGWELVEGGADLAAIGRTHDDTIDRIAAVSRRLLRRDAPRSLVNAAFSALLRDRWDDGARLTNWRLRRLLPSSPGGAPFFLFVNYLEPHLEYDPPEPFRYRFLPEDVDPEFADSVRQDAWAYLCGQLELGDREFAALSALYDAEIAYLDHRIGALVDLLDDRGLLEETAVFVTGDHGENVGEHSLMDHQYCLYDTLLHVPLVARCPDALGRGVVADELVELRDLYPTILELSGADGYACGGPVEGDDRRASDVRPPQSLLERAGRDHVLAEYLTPQPSMEALEERVGTVPEEVQTLDRRLRSVRTRQWKYVEASDGAEELYRVATDPDESEDLSGTHAEACSDLRALLREELGEPGSPADDENADVEHADVDRPTQRRLEKLGYLQ